MNEIEKRASEKCEDELLIVNRMNLSNSSSCIVINVSKLLHHNHGRTVAVFFILSSYLLCNEPHIAKQFVAQRSRMCSVMYYCSSTVEHDDFSIIHHTDNEDVHHPHRLPRH